MFDNFELEGFHKGELRTSFVTLYTGEGEVVRWRYVLPSVRVTSWVKV